MHFRYARSSSRPSRRKVCEQLDIIQASNRLSKIDLRLEIDNLEISVTWFRVMKTSGEWIIDRHMHSSYEFHFVTEGGCRVRLDGCEFHARAGEFYLTAPQVYHEQSGEGNGRYTEYSINYDIHIKDGRDAGSAEGAALLEVLNTAGCRAVPDDFGGIRFFNEALAEALSQKTGYYSNLRCLAAMILTAAARAFDDSRKYAVPMKRNESDYHFMEIERFVNDNLSTPIGVESIAGHLYLSSRQINRIVMRYTGKTAKKYISARKLEKAKELLRDSSLSIRQISEKLGFTSEYYFSQFFRREEGYPPGRYRRSVLG